VTATVGRAIVIGTAAAGGCAIATLTARSN
jgi:hypothetical protein